MLFYDSFCIYPCNCYVQFREKIKLSVSVSDKLVGVVCVRIFSENLNLVPKCSTTDFSNRTDTLTNGRPINHT